MSFAEIKAELPKLTAQQRASLARELQAFEPFNDAEMMERIALSIDAIEQGEPCHSKDDLLQRLREAGRTV